MFCDPSAGNGQKGMVLKLHDSVPTQGKLNYVEDKPTQGLKQWGQDI